MNREDLAGAAAFVVLVARGPHKDKAMDSMILIGNKCRTACRGILETVGPQRHPAA